MSRTPNRQSRDHESRSHADGAASERRGRIRNASYEVGYGKPPAEHRFPKGQSGNPRGRPKKAEKRAEPRSFRDAHLHQLLEQEAFRTLQLHENGRPMEMSAAQAVFRSLIVEGVKGNRLAKKYAYQLLREEEREALRLSVDQYEHFARVKAEGEARIARCRERGVPPPRMFPHPDDILLDAARPQVHILGPVSEDEAIPYERTALARDWFSVYSVLQERSGGNVMTPEIDGKSMPAADLIAWLINNALPPSFQRNEDLILEFLMNLQRLTKPELRRRLDALSTQISDMPDSIEERLAARERALNALSVVGDGFVKAATEFAAQEG